MTYNDDTPGYADLVLRFVGENDIVFSTPYLELSCVALDGEPFPGTMHYDLQLRTFPWEACTIS